MPTAPSSPPTRREDPALLRGVARYTDDRVPDGAVHAAFVRSPYAHTRITDVDTGPAASMEGVLDAFAWADVEASGAPGLIKGQRPLPGQSDDVPTQIRRSLAVPTRRLLAADRVRFQGEPVAIVIAEDRYRARDAAEVVDVAYERLDAATDVESARGSGAIPIHDAAPDNVAFDWARGDAAAVEAAFDDAAHAVSASVRGPQLVPTPMEPRAAVVDPDDGGRLVATLSTQVPHLHRDLIADALGQDPSSVRVVAPAVGGGFGGKMNDYPEELVVAWAAGQVGRPVAWQARRSAAFLADGRSRGHRIDGELALDAEGRFTAIRVRSRVPVGAAVGRAAASILTAPLAATLSGQYAVPAIHCRVTGVFTNTAPVGPYRGTSRPDGLVAVERLVNRAARALGEDPADLRRRNMVTADAFPYRTPLGTVYDSGDYRAALDRALEIVGYDAFRGQQAQLQEDGQYLGIGMACGVDEGGTPHPEWGTVRIDGDGTATATCGTADQGQGHRTVYARIVADRLGVAPDDVDVIEGDTDAVPEGSGTFGSRSVFQGGSALAEGADALVERGRAVAADALEADVDDVAFDEGRFHLRGAPDRSLSWEHVATAAAESDPDAELSGASRWSSGARTVPHCTHIAVVAVEPETGAIDLRRYVAVDDCGRRIHPAIVEGQIHGGVTQGIGQARFEGVAHDDVGNLLTASLMDYALPKAAGVPPIETDALSTLSPTNPLGVKSIGESGAIAAPAAVLNAVCDALAPFEVDGIDLPLTDEAVWQAIQTARKG